MVKINFDDTEVAFAWQSTAKLYESLLVFKTLKSDSLVNFGTNLITWALNLHLPITPLVKHTIFRQFCGGTSIHDCLSVLERMQPFGVKGILDYSVEACECEKEFENVAKEILRTIDFAKHHSDLTPISVFKMTGVVRFGLLESFSKNGCDLNKLDEKEKKEFESARVRLAKICQSSFDAKIPIMIDAEDSWIQDGIDFLSHELMRQFNRERCIVYNTLQMYRWDRLDYLKEQTEKAKAEGYKFGAKLVRGAYVEKERDRAKQLGYPSPIQKDKASTDRDFDLAIRYCVDHLNEVGLFLGTHNEESCELLATLIDERKIDRKHPNIYFSQLFGMSDNVSYNLAKHGFNVAKYLPYGPVKSVLPYLFRRAQENSSLQGHAVRELDLICKELKRRAKA